MSVIDSDTQIADIETYLSLPDPNPSPLVQHENPNSHPPVIIAEFKQFEYGQLLHCVSRFADNDTDCGTVTAGVGKLCCAFGSAFRRSCFVCDHGENESAFCLEPAERKDRSSSRGDIREDDRTAASIVETESSNICATAGASHRS
jgi:hypothetical protein